MFFKKKKKEKDLFYFILGKIFLSCPGGPWTYNPPASGSTVATTSGSHHCSRLVTLFSLSALCIIASLGQRGLCLHGFSTSCLWSSDFVAAFFLGADVEQAEVKHAPQTHSASSPGFLRLAACQAAEPRLRCRVVATGPPPLRGRTFPTRTVAAFLLKTLPKC